ncbi:MAG: hypothetical protein Q9214_004666, partial [Letrouitia sp. 1 TL-2023]
MAVSNRKRKAVTRDSPKSEQVVLSDGGEPLMSGALDNILSQSEDSGSDEENSQSDQDSGFDEVSTSEDDIVSNEIPSDEEEEDTQKQRQKQNQDLVKINGSADHGGEKAHSSEENIPNYVETTDANGNPRYIYRDIDPVYDSDDSAAPATTNTIGNIPLSFYDSYPHIGYDINGKKITRPAQGEALDALLDSIDIPQGWTGLTDPSTGKPLELSQEELEIVKKIQKSEIPEEDFDPYPTT